MSADSVSLVSPAQVQTAGWPFKILGDGVLGTHFSVPALRGAQSGKCFSPGASKGGWFEQICWWNLSPPG